MGILVDSTDRNLFASHQSFQSNLSAQFTKLKTSLNEQHLFYQLFFFLLPLVVTILLLLLQASYYFLTWTVQICLLLKLLLEILHSVSIPDVVQD